MSSPKLAARRKTNWLSVAALLCVAVLLVCAFLGLMGVMTVGSGAAIFVLAVGFNGVICAALSYHLNSRL